MYPPHVQLTLPEPVDGPVPMPEPESVVLPGELVSGEPEPEPEEPVPVLMVPREPGPELVPTRSPTSASVV